VTVRGRRVELDAVFVLHHRPWRDTSRMLDVFTREHGRLMLFARGVRGPRSRSASLLQPFVPLLASWTGSGETAQLTQVEAAPGGPVASLPAGALLSGWYLNELLLKLVLRADPQPAVFDLYARTLDRLRDGQAVAAVLRGFERDLLDGMDRAERAALDRALDTLTTRAHALAGALQQTRSSKLRTGRRAASL
jgi:DNA repair protein RecO (recombination protein O)